MAVYRLDDELWFPDPYMGEDDGLIAVGGDLSVDRLLLAYSNGFFPWFSYKMYSEPHWYCPLDRFVIFPDEIHISHSMRQIMKQDKYVVTFNRCFDGVIRGCAAAGGRGDHPGAWLSPDMIEAYTELHRRNYAASVEVWELSASPSGEKEATLVGGLYGVSLGNAFMGESMFSLVPNASKLALIHLAHIAREAGLAFIDCQLETPHLKSMGGRHIPYDKYISLLHS